MKRFLAILSTLAVAWGCTADDATGPTAAGQSPNADQMVIAPNIEPFLGRGMMHRADPLTIMTYNLYIGTDVDRVLASPPDEFDQRVQEALATFIATDYGERSGAIADLIMEANPHVVGLQEVYVISTQGIAGLPDMTVDFLQILMAQLAGRGLDYQVAAQEMLTNLQLPVGAGGVGLVDSDALLVRGDVPFDNTEAVVYQAKLTVPFGPATLDILRGYTAADVRVGGKRYRVVNTHFEPKQPVPQIQQAQAGELLAALAEAHDPVVVVGDLNSGPADADPAAPYNQLRASHFTDAWLKRVPRGRRFDDPGYTCCQAADLQNATSQLVERIDLIMVRNDFDFLPRSVVGPSRVEVVGDEQADRTASGLWPSDHAGVVATFRLPTMRGLARNR
ncbi:MAG: endonuclease/exonuclease/phosphatase family protein [Gemmatimonadetes bacterium]|nr:endonuclease/exonuclease/phosphatase family protein [Gemmatimonadota bacterium]